ncbi:hypothetical protein HDU98_007954 [Podochytrium sp. JEL0797]|nr:hypothetical protein HDU98_007954 [Podochytrium sp. JEL0797]
MELKRYELEASTIQAEAAADVRVAEVKLEYMKLSRVGDAWGWVWREALFPLSYLVTEDGFHLSHSNSRANLVRLSLFLTVITHFLQHPKFSRNLSPPPNVQMLLKWITATSWGLLGIGEVGGAWWWYLRARAVGKDYADVIMKDRKAIEINEEGRIKPISAPTIQPETIEEEKKRGPPMPNASTKPVAPINSGGSVASPAISSKHSTVESGSSATTPVANRPAAAPSPRDVGTNGFNFFKKRNSYRGGF